MFRTTAAALVAGLVTAVPATAVAAEGETACQRVWDAMPVALQDDIEAAVSLAPRAQHRAMIAIRYAALHGTYGERVEAAAERLRERRVAAYWSFPAQLKADLRAARSLGFHEQRRAMRAISTAALAGVYGEDVQALAERRKAFYAGCDGVAQSSAGATGDPLVTG